MKKIFLLLLIPFSLFSGERWERHKEESLKSMEQIPGWCTKNKAVLMMDLIKKEKFKRCVEIGVYAGMSLFPMAQALKYTGSGIVIGIDAWDGKEATQGLKETNENFIWWNQQDFPKLYQQTLDMIGKYNLKDCCQVIRQASQMAINQFADQSIDFIHFDGNHTEDLVTLDVKSYFKKVKDGGYILLSDSNWASMRQVLVFLLERTDLISNFSPGEQFMLFRKNAKREKAANQLMKGA